MQSGNQTNSSSPPIAILSALHEEMAPIRKLLADRRITKSGEGTYFTGVLSGRPVALVQTGMGIRASRGAADWIIRATAPRLILAIGFAGGLRDEFQTGDLVLADEVFEPPPPEGEGPRIWEADGELVEIARSINVEGIRPVRGRLVTVRKVIPTAARKRDLGERHDAMAVDMESSGIARAANVHDVRVVYARVIVDDVNCDLPLDFTGLLNPQGRARPLRMLGALLRRPGAIKGFLDLRERTLRGASVLSRYVAALISVLPSE